MPVPLRPIAAALLLAAAAGRAVAQPGAGPMSCAPGGLDRAGLMALKESGFTVSDDARRHALALELTACLADPDPTIRDGVAYEALQAWMRGKLLAPGIVEEIRDRLVPWLTADEGTGFARPFAALVLAEVARTDRIDPWMRREERTSLVGVATSYLAGVRDYRGFDAQDGWRHGVAHGADLVMQLAYNPNVGREDLQRILGAVESQVAPDGHFYIYGEPGRLAAPVIAVARRGVLTSDEWAVWFARISGPAPLARWGDAFGSQRGLAKRHNTLAFLSFLYANARIGGAEALAPLLPGIEAGLRGLP
jgi:hypothetical protein